MKADLVVKGGTIVTPDATVHVDITPAHQLNSFDPDSALGSSLDVLSHRDIDRVHTPHIVQESLSAGWGPIRSASSSACEPRRAFRSPSTSSGRGATR